ncbi:hypothetical protein [Achromobacter sp. NFACC18-2]|uniref:hypothetical protein n=1 Tax=Achromobacter sp. NFACC18-2 TaxID=1564112 RepID=UPI0008AE7F7F|nr:hypothetical protein [Achromobacter sp. NFACC18-2]SEJ02283.1 hypothetical protein SAMN03159494_01456 [Achromobacter sp. NFACC18-2]
MPVLILSILAAVLLGCFCLYRASPNQRWGAAPWPVAPARVSGVALLALGAWGCLAAHTVLAAVFVFCTALMLFFCLVPYLAVLRQLRRGDANEAR